MTNFIIELKDKSNETEFKLELHYKPKGQNEALFSFSNFAYNLERNDLIFEDGDGNKLISRKRVRISPQNSEKTDTVITKEKPFIYEVKGTVNNEGDQVKIDLITAEYHLKKGVTYQVYVVYPGGNSNALEIMY